MDRREFLTGALTMAVAAGTTPRARAAASAAARDPKLAKAVETALECVKAAEWFAAVLITTQEFSAKRAEFMTAKGITWGAKRRPRTTQRI